MRMEEPAGAPPAPQRTEDARLVTGAGRFVDDISAGGALHAAFVRCATGPGRAAPPDLAQALAMSGVRLAVAANETAGLGEIAVNGLGETLAYPPQPPLTLGGECRAIGQIIAMVVADSALTAAEAAETVRIEMSGEAPSPLAPVFRKHWSAGDVERAFAQAAAVASLTVSHSLVAPLALEPRATLAVPDGAGGLTLFLGTQTPHRSRDELARILGLAAARVRVVAPDIGGAFGGKASLTPEDALVAFAALRLGRPVRWTATRGEDFLAAPLGRGGRLAASIAFAADGRALALKAEGAFPVGAWLPFSAIVPARNAGRILPGPYAIPAVDIIVESVPGPTAPVGIYRGAGRPEAALVLERLMDEGAALLGLDPLAIRKRNLLSRRAFTRLTPTGERYDSGDPAGLLRQLTALEPVRRSRAALARRRRRGEIAGCGFALYVEPCGQGFESARLTLSVEGALTLATGAGAQGQGRETTFARIVGEALGVPREAVRVIHGDTAAVASGLGSLASRSTAIGGSAALLAARELIARARKAGVNDERIDWRAVGSLTGGIDVETSFTSPREAWASGAAFAAVSVDRDTGVLTVEELALVDDAGVIIEPVLAAGQLLGGIAQGLGEALMERMVYSVDGQLVTGSLMDYAAPRASDIPPVTLASRHTPSPLNPLGAKGVGEAGCIGIPAAIVNAAVDALRPFGVRHLDMPLTSQSLWRAMQGKGAP